MSCIILDSELLCRDCYKIEVPSPKAEGQGFFFFFFFQLWSMTEGAVDEATGHRQLAEPFVSTVLLSLSFFFSPNCLCGSKSSCYCIQFFLLFVTGRALTTFT